MNILNGFLWTFAVLGLISVGLPLLLALVFLVLRKIRRRIRKKTVLELDLTKGVVERASDDPIEKWRGGSSLSVYGIVSSLEKASQDPRIEGLWIRFGFQSMGLAHAQEIREAIEDFKSHGKWVVAHGESLGEGTPALFQYVILSACDRISLLPQGELGLVGMAFRVPFFKGVLDRLGVVPRLEHRKEYKNAKNTFTEKAFTPPHREALAEIMNSQFSQAVNLISKGRKLPADQCSQILKNGPYSATEAKELGLVDALEYGDEVRAHVAERVKTKDEALRLLYLERYFERTRGAYGHPVGKKGKTLALVFGVGEIQPGKSRVKPQSRSPVMGGETVAAALREALEDDSVDAILFRVDSPGGAHTAADLIWRETMRIKEKGKPLVVSMSNVAGSGGYYVAMNADCIVAQGGTITGSIGVLGGKFVIRSLLEKTGLTFDKIDTGEMAGYGSFLEDFSSAGQEKLSKSIDRVYGDFTSKVAKGRSFSPEEVESVAKGRIWTGEKGKELRLVDELGGFKKAMEKLRELLKVPADAPLQVRTYPRPRPLIQRMRERQAENSESQLLIESIIYQWKRSQRKNQGQAELYSEEAARWGFHGEQGFWES